MTTGRVYVLRETLLKNLSIKGTDAQINTAMGLLNIFIVHEFVELFPSDEFGDDTILKLAQCRPQNDVTLHQSNGVYELHRFTECRFKNLWFFGCSVVFNGESHFRHVINLHLKNVEMTPGLCDFIKRHKPLYVIHVSIQLTVRLTRETTPILLKCIEESNLRNVIEVYDRIFFQSSAIEELAKKRLLKLGQAGALEAALGYANRSKSGTRSRAVRFSHEDGDHAIAHGILRMLTGMHLGHRPRN